MCMPPLKLNPLKAGISREIGIPEIKKAIVGSNIITDKFIQKTGYCTPVRSCFRRAYLKNKTAKIIAITRNKYTNSIPFSVSGLGI